MTAARSRAERFGRLDLRRAPSAMEQRAATWSAPQASPAPAPSASGAPARRVVPVPVAQDLRGADRGGASVKPAFNIGHREDGGSLRRFKTPKPQGARVVLAEDHPASANATTLFPTRVFHASLLPRLLKSGANASKIGKVVTKGKWATFPIYTLTLEERATCPRSCAQWASCYGNNMHLAERAIADDAMESRLWRELGELQRKHAAGFVVRLHILGDFRDVDYVELWDHALDEFPALRVFGYTAHAPGSEIGAYLREIATERWDRFALRFSGAGDASRGAEVVDSPEDTTALICPAQLGKTDCCATCALCWQSDRTIAFLRH